tara:strand:- start:24 stop:452 length:429 start_codon:yes stop_codon:yes gene_type:complete
MNTATVDTTSVNSISQSYGRCINQPKFFDTFYKKILDSNPKIAPMFSNTDFEKQKDLLRKSIIYVITYADKPNSHFAQQKLFEVGTIHSISNINVPPELYPYWSKSLIDTIAEFDPQFSLELEQQWYLVVEPALDLLASKYR